VLVLVLQGVAHTVMLGRAWFTQDDYLMLARSVGQPLTWEFLTQGYSGHLFPGGFLLAWFHANQTPLDWAAAVVPLVLLQLSCCVMVWLVVTRILGPVWARLPVLVLFALCPLTLISIQWWAVSIQFLPVTLFSLLAVWAFLVRRDGGGRWWWLVVVGAVVGALLFQERGLLVPLIVFLVAVAVEDAAPGWGRPWRAAVTAWPLWLACGVVVGGYLLLHRALVPIVTTSGGGSGDLGLVRNLVLRNAIPGLWGGPVAPRVIDDSIVDPSTAAWVVPGVATVLLVVWTVRRGGPATRWAWGGMTVLTAANVGLLFFGRSQLGEVFGLNPRYAADLVPTAAVLAAVVIADTRALRGARSSLVVAVAYTVVAATTTLVVLPATYNDVDRRYVEAVRADLRANPQVVLYDGGVPDDMMVGWFGDDARLSVVLATAPENPVFDLPTSRLRMADPQGRIREVALVGGVAARPPEDRTCGYHVTASPTVVPLDGAIDARRQVLRMGFYTDTATTASVRVGDRVHRIAIGTGLNSADVVVSGSSTDRVTLSIDHPTATLCVPSLQVGFATPLGG
jgi:hypothetical protein